MSSRSRAQRDLRPGVRVLVVEDDEDVMRLLVSHLTYLGCQVAEARTGEAGLDRAIADPPEVAIIDVLLPGLGGQELAGAMRADERTQGCRIVMTSVLDRQDLGDIAAAVRTEAILPKPFSRSDVADILRAVAGGAAR